jgi:hypothetical protein
MDLFGKNSLELFHSDKCLTNDKVLSTKKYKAKYARAKYDRANKINEAK